MGVADRFADSNEMLEQTSNARALGARVFARRRITLLDRIIERLAADVAHGIVGLIAFVSKDAVNGHDSRMLKPAGQLRFRHKAPTARGIDGRQRLHHLDRDITTDLLVPRDKNGSQSTLRMKLQRFIPPA